MVGRDSRSGPASVNAWFEYISPRAENRFSSAHRSFVNVQLSTSHLKNILIIPFNTMQTFSVLIVSAIAFAGGAAASNTRRMTNYPIRQNGYSEFCEEYGLLQNGSVLQVSGECSPEPNGARIMGAALFVSHIDLNKCLTNVDGDIVPSQV